ncbi:hypothetical protein DFH28DRAFT_934875 [Melampsora americana]|nr:hypothetical protein DFH28DRAFT_934875 [Melampsora americana]
MKSSTFLILLISTVMWLHIPSVHTRQRTSLLKREVGPKLRLFCHKSKKRVIGMDVTCTAPAGQKSSQPTCEKLSPYAESKSALRCTNMGKLIIHFSDCDEEGIKPELVLCENPVDPVISCKAGESGTQVKRPPQINCLVNGINPSIYDPQCTLLKPESYGTFAGTLQCQPGATMTFEGGDSKGKNPCASQARPDAKLFCTKDKPELGSGTTPL